MKCQQPGCDDIAVLKVFWPDYHPVYTCEAHAQVAKEMADSLKVTLLIEEVYACVVLEGELDDRNSQ